MTHKEEIQKLHERIAYLEGKIAGLTQIIKSYQKQLPNTVLLGSTPKNHS